MSAFASTGAQNGLPADPEAFARDVRAAIRLDYELQQDFTYLERRRDIKLSRLGKVTIGPVRTFEVYPSARPGHTYKRLVAVDDKPLSAAELARRDAERERDLRHAAERERSESPRQRAARLEADAKEARERDEILDDALAVFEPTFTGTAVVDGQAVVVADVRPRQDVKVRTRQGEWFKKFIGRVWIANADRQIVRLDMRAIDDVTLGWGIVGRVHEGSRFLFVRRRIEDVWLPAEVTFEASGRTLIFRRFQVSNTTTYSHYRRLSPR
jgi:hypothetical protein